MSLIADALKAAQHEKIRLVPGRSGAAGAENFYSLRSARARNDSIPRPLLYVLGGLAGFLVVGGLVTLLVTSSKAAAPLAAAPAIQPSAAPQAASPPPLSEAPATTVDSAATSNSVPVSDAPMPARVTPPRMPPPSPDGARTRPVGSDSTALRADSTRSSSPQAATTSGTLRIMMDQPPAADTHQLFQQALAAHRRGDLSAAKDLYLRALNQDPNNADIYNNLGMLYRTTGELDRAEDAYRRAIALNSRIAPVWSNLGVLLEARGKTKEATAALQQALAIDPNNPDTKVNLALQYEAAGLTTDARHLLEDAIRINPAMPEAHYALARVLEALGDPAGAIAHYDIFLRTSSGRFGTLENKVRQHLAVLRAAQ